MQTPSPTWERSQQASLPHNLNPTYTPKKIPPLPEFPTRQEPLAITPPPNTRPTTTRPFGENPLASALFGLDAPPPSLLNHRGPATVLFSSAPHNLRPIQTPQFFINAKKHINRLVSEIKQDPQKAHANLNAGAIQGIGILAKETLKLSATLQPLNQAQKIVSCISSILGINTDPKFQRELAHGQLETIDRASSYLRSRYHSGLQRLDIDTNSAAFSAGSFVVSELLPYCIPMGAAARAPSIANRLRTFQKIFTHLGKTEIRFIEGFERVSAKINYQLQPQLVPAERGLARRATEQLELKMLKPSSKTEQAVVRSTKKPPSRPLMEGAQKSHDIKHRKINPKKEQREISRIDKMSEGGAQRKGCPRNNIAQNKMAEGARQEIERKLGRKLEKHEQREFHNAVTGQNFTYQELVEEGLNLFQKK